MLSHVPSGYCEVVGGSIAYYVFSAEAAGKPVIVIPGGPGVPSHYLHPVADQLSDNPIIFYDPLDCGFSDKSDNPAH